MNGYIKIDRQILDWEWWDDDKTLKLWITILLMANWEEKNWHGKTIPRGSFWTSIPKLQKVSGLSYQEVRTALCKLVSTGEITDESTGSGRLITVVNYRVFQDKPSKSNKQRNKQPNKQSTTTEEYKEIKKKVWGEGGIKREYI